MMSENKSCKLQVKESAIHGKGLFAAAAISANEMIGKLQGTHTCEDGMYVLWLDQQTGFRVEGDLKYINHSDTPNACYYDDRSVMALRDIAVGEEITHNYEADW
jgi:SET domain-containing protein